MITKIKNGLKKRKVKLFIICLVCSFLAWFINNLSEPYIGNTVFDLNYIGLPTDKMLIEASSNMLDVKIEAIGFQFLRYNFKNKTVTIELSKVQERGGRYFMAPDQYQKQIENQLSSATRLVQAPRDTLFFDLQEIITKEIPVEPIIEMSFAQNHILDGLVQVEPSSVFVAGPANKLEDMVTLKTSEIILDNLTSDFSEKVSLIKPDSLFNVDFSIETVIVGGKVSRFSEKIIEVPIEVLNLPENITIQTFPDEIEILFKARISELKSFSSSDFKVIADFKNSNGKENTLALLLREKPKTFLVPLCFREK